jgi:hypothetical protein
LKLLGSCRHQSIEQSDGGAAHPIEHPNLYRGESEMHRTHIALLPILLWGCADRQTDLGMHLEELHRADGDPISVSGCRHVDGAISERACIVDSSGTNFPIGGELVVTSATPPYGAYVEFSDGLEIDADKIGTEGADAPIKAYAAPYSMQGDPCCAEADPANRIAVQASIAREGGLFAIIDESVPSGTQISVEIALADLFRPLPEGSDLDNFCPGGGFACAGFALRFYVGEEPPLNGTPNANGVDTKAESAGLPLESGR